MRSPLPILLLAALSTPLSAQTHREQAVAIDRVEVPPAEDLEIDAIGPEMQFPWSLAILPDGAFLVSEKHRGLRLIDARGGSAAITGTLPPQVFAKEDSGYLDVALDPDFARNRMVYLAYVEGSEEANRTAIWKARLDGGKLTGGRTIFRSNVAKKAPSHPGGRILFLPDGTLLLTVGDGYDYKVQAQDPASHLGKVLRLTADGAVPADNPFVGKPGYAPEVWTLGHRNIQGLFRDPASGAVWANEHGPRGGDEVNLLAPGKNYGWPLALFGIDYDGKRISDRLHIDGSEDPLFFWAPSIAPSGMAIYHGSLFPNWEGKMLVGALASKGLIVLRRGKETGLLIEEARLLTALRWRIRDVRVGSDGAVYLLTDEERGRLLRLRPRTAQARFDADHPLAPIAGLAGDWEGSSRFAPLRDKGRTVIDETSTMRCRPVLGDRHLRCTARFVRSDGRVRTVELSYSGGEAGTPIKASVLSDRWSGLSVDAYARANPQAAWIAEHPFEEEGKAFVERVSMQLSPDGTAFTQIEASRPAAGHDWTETFRWTLRKKSAT